MSAEETIQGTNIFLRWTLNTIYFTLMSKGNFAELNRLFLVGNYAGYSIESFLLQRVGCVMEINGRIVLELSVVTFCLLSQSIL